MRIGKAAFLAIMMASVSSAVLADDWIAERLRGSVMQFQGGDWVALQRGDVVPDGRKIRTAGDGRVELVRGQERIALAANTEIAVRDAAGQKMTTVVQTLGSVTIEAERRNVQHFSVQTPVLAAVVKGTQFTVTYRNGQARVDVERGVVQVQDSSHSMVVDVTPGQSAAASQSRPLDVSGPGSDRVTYLIEGEVVPAAARDAVVSGEIAAKDAVAVVEGRGVSGNPGNGNGPRNSNGNGNASGNASASAGIGVGPVNVEVRASSPGNNGNGVGQGNTGNNGNGNRGNGNVSVDAGPVSVDVRSGNSGNGNSGNGNSGNGNSGNGNGNSGNGNGNGNSGNGNGKGNSGNGNGNGGGVNVGVDLGIVSVDVNAGGGNGLGLGLGL
ncbi:FecR family protein [Devosia lucknowensis]|uniref:FecR family protein n=1 Tax=Devosia lucknowensis TaxID=1096929 RepID=A0A1Y6F5N5_9HYPH|nr:FecR family protein [Devosia lucknowensis]SMQ70268.1 FecR family protein [Devosia lucknowensis]